jgi:hypothetical protein
VPEAALPALCAAHSRLVAHFPVAGADACGRVDEHLDALARAHPATRFVRVAPARGGASPALAAAGAGAGAPPAVLVFRRGALAALAPGYGPFGGAGEGLREDRLTRWLQRAGALPDGGGGSSSDEDEVERDGADVALGRRGAPLPPCATCGRTYAHEHVRALRAGGAGDSDSDE